MEGDEDEDEDARAARLAEERRKRREAIMAKHAAAKQNAHVDADENVKDVPKDANAAAPVAQPTGPASATPPVPANPSPRSRIRNPPDMFAAEDDEDEAEERENARASRLTASGAKGSAADMSRGLADNWDDADGYYCARVGEVLDGRYVVSDTHGRGRLQHGGEGARHARSRRQKLRFGFGRVW